MIVRALGPAEILARLDEIAALRITVFRDWPYLYEGTVAYERNYLRPYAESAGAVVVGAFDGHRLVGAATGTPLADHAEAFGAALAGSGLDMPDIFYCAESVLLPDFRGQGIGHRFFDIRERHAAEKGFSHVAFCAVIRPDDHPLSPPAYRSLDGFWRARGYAPLPGAIASFAWTDLGETTETEKPMQFWSRRL
jgi:GNAT superfamily N-acetyltransferase